MKSLIFLDGRGGGLMSAKIVNKNFVNKLAFPNNGSEVPQGTNRQTINLAQKWVKNGFFVFGWRWPKSGSKVLFLHKIGPETHLDPRLGHFQP